MPKMFRPFPHFLLLSALSLSSFAAQANADEPMDKHPLCPIKPKQNMVDNSAEPSADQYRAAMAASVKSASERLDWVDDPDSNTLCGGYYQTPFNPNPEKHIDADKASTKISAGDFSQGQDGFTEMQGDVEFFQGKRSFRCDSLRYSEQQQYTELNGNIILREENALVMADSAIIDGKNQRSEFHNTQFLLAENQLRGKAATLKGQSGEQEIIELDDASFTLCPPNQESWAIAASDIDLDITEGWGKARHSVIKIKDVPVFYFPYFDFPIDDRRKSGFLWPSISGGSGGLDISLPYYFNLAPNYDLTYQGRYFAEHGYQHGLETRYKNRLSEWQLGGTYINDDKQIGDVKTADDDSLDSSRWLGFVKESGNLTDSLRSYIDYTAVSDVEYFRDWGTKGLDIKKSLNIERRAGLNFQSDNWFADARVVDYQALELDATTGDIIDDKYQLLPQIDLGYIANHSPYRLSPVFYSQYSHFSHDLLPEAQRLYNEAGASFPVGGQAFLSTLKLSAKTLNYRYSSDNEITDVNDKGETLRGSEQVAVGTAGLDNRLFLQRYGSFLGNGYLQTLTPRLKYYYAENKDQSDLISFDTSYQSFSYQQVFREERFAGFDRISDANQLSLGFDTAIFGQSLGSQSFHFGIGQIFYFADREVALHESDKEKLSINPGDNKATIKQKQSYNAFVEKQFYRNSSDIALDSSWQYLQNHGIYSDVIYDPYNSNISVAGIAYHYENEREQMLNIGYRYRENDVNLSNQSVFTDVNQANVSFYSPVSLNWSLFASSSYDIKRSESIENLVGFKYGSCCWSVLFAWQQERKNFADGVRIDDSSSAEYDRNWYIQFELTGLGSVSRNISRLLEESIEGFNRRDRFN
jgi:LPS-assembly protein